VSWLTKMSLRNRSIVGLVVVAVVIFGAIAVSSLKQELIPDLTFPYLTVFTVDPGTSPSDVERNVTTPLKQSIKTTSGVKEYDSFSNEGMSIITVQYEFGTDMKAKEAEVQQAVSGAQQSLPQTAQAPEVAVLNFNSMPVVQLAVSSSLPPQKLATQVGAQVTPRLQGIPGAVSAMLTRLPVPGAEGMVPLSQIATIAEVKAPVQVTHVDGERTASITAAAVNNNIGAASSAVTKAMESVQMPAGATWSLAGATEATNDVFRTLGIAMLIAILLVYLIMVATFRSLLNPLILLVSIPFAAVGAVIALVATGTALGMPSLVGLLMLIGIVVTNAIVLLDLVEQFRRRGMDARSAVIEGGRRRLRPILMTAVATILALTPMALGMGKGGFLSTPLAIVVIGGLFTSTVLTLVLVPVLYLVFDRLRPKNAYADEEVGPVPLEAETSPG